MKIVICGSRQYTDWYAFYLKVDPILKEIGLDNIEIVSGLALGPDMLAVEYARMNNMKLTTFPAQWEIYGKSAGYRRNAEMMRYCLDDPKRRVIAFWNKKSKGTKHMLDICKIHGFDVQVIEVS